MISVQEAQLLITKHSPLYPPEATPTLQAHGKILAEDILAERENPPFHRIAMDGIAINFQTYADGLRQFPIKGIQAAGHPPLSLDDKNTCLEAMTGGVLPQGCNCVIPVERITIENNIATIEDGLELRKWQNVHRQGSDHTAGFVLAAKGQILNTPEIAVAAAAGYAKIKTAKTPTISIIATGDELVGPDEEIKPWQIRRSNTTAICAALHGKGYINSSEYHLKDDLDVLRTEIKKLLEQSDMLILTGGVSMGKFDFVPQVFKEIGVEEIFHKVSQRPGKPLWFGKLANKTIFGLPGNPVSAVINFNRYILPQLQLSSGIHEPLQLKAKLSEDFSFNKSFTRFLPVKTQSSDQGELIASPQNTNGSGDFGALSASDGFLELPAEIANFEAGFVAKFFPW